MKIELTRDASLPRRRFEDRLSGLGPAWSKLIACGPKPDMREAVK